MRGVVIVAGRTEESGRGPARLGARHTSADADGVSERGPRITVHSRLPVAPAREPGVADSAPQAASVHTFTVGRSRPRKRYLRGGSEPRRSTPAKKVSAWKIASLIHDCSFEAAARR